VRGALGLAARALGRIRDVWREIRAWRRISFTAGGGAFTAGTFAVGFAAMNTGNNLLYLLLGAMLGLITVSGWLSEQVIHGLRISRRIPRAVSAGHDLRIAYEVSNLKTRLPTTALEIGEGGLPGRAFVPHVEPGGTTHVRSSNTFARRGVYRLGTVTLSTAFPFGMFLKERDMEISGEVVVWPRTDRQVPPALLAGGRLALRGATASRSAAGHRGEYRSLRAYRPGDDPRDIHWRSSARFREPVLREYEREGAEALWICLDLRSQPGDAAEEAVEVSASLAAQAMAEGRSFALVAGDVVVDPGDGPGQLERILDALARVDFRPDAPASDAAAAPESCVVVSASGVA